MAPPVPVICGPTAGGKTALGVALAHAMAARGMTAEIVTADAFQVYRGMDVGTAKPTREEMCGVPHHVIDVVDAREKFTASQWLGLARGAIDACAARGSVAIVVGGTHLYVKLLVDGMFEGPGADEALREELMAKTPQELRAELERVDPASAARLHANDVRRTVRALEVFRLTGRAISEHQTQWEEKTGTERPAATRLIVLSWETEAINRRINARVKQMVERGLEAEVRGLWERGALGPTAREALGYKQFVDCFEGRCSREEAIEKIKIETRRFAKNQRTWLRRLGAREGAIVIDAGKGEPGEWAEVVAGKLMGA